MAQHQQRLVQLSLCGKVIWVYFFFVVVDVFYMTVVLVFMNHESGIKID